MRCVLGCRVCGRFYVESGCKRTQIDTLTPRVSLLIRCQINKWEFNQKTLEVFLQCDVLVASRAVRFREEWLHLVCSEGSRVGHLTSGNQ